MAGLLAAALLGAVAGLLPGVGAMRPRPGKDPIAEITSELGGGSQESLISATPRGSLSPDCKSHEGKRVVLVTVSSDYFVMFKNWLGFALPFLHQDTEHLHVVAEDPDVVEDLKAVLEGVRDEVDFTVASPPKQTSLISGPYGSKEYGKVVWERPEHILDLLQDGCSVLYADIDAVWAKDPFLDIDAAGSGDLYLTNDRKKDINYCTCFMYMHPTDAILSLIQSWHDRANGNVNQGTFNYLLQLALESSDLPSPQMVVLPFDRYPNGAIARHADFDATVFHANCMVGMTDKVEFFRNHSLWNPENIQWNPDSITK